MSNKTETKICRYAKCLHPHKLIDVSKDRYCVFGKAYYHCDCYELKKKGDLKNERIKRDFQYIKGQWLLHIDKSVVYSRLFKSLNELLDNGFTRCKTVTNAFLM